MIVPTSPEDFETIFAIINDAAAAYRGVIPDDCWHDPYMSREALTREIAAGVRFWGFVEGETLLGVMGIQAVRDVTLIRHAYVRTAGRRRGIGSTLLSHLLEQTATPVLIGTWQAATWAIDFYQKNGFTLVTARDKNRLLEDYWSISPRQVETSVVLTNRPDLYPPC